MAIGLGLLLRRSIVLPVLAALSLSFGSPAYAGEARIYYEVDGKTRRARSDAGVEAVVVAVIRHLRRSLALEATVPSKRLRASHSGGDSRGLEYAAAIAQLQDDLGLFRDRSVLASEASESFLNAGDDYFGTASRLATDRDDVLNAVLKAENALESRLDWRTNWLYGRIREAGSVESSLTESLADMEPLPASIDAWWSSLVVLRTTLLHHGNDFPRSDYPRLDYVSLDWQRGETELDMDRAIPPVLVRQLEGRIEHEKLALARLSQYVDRQIESHKALNAYRFVSARRRFGAPRCDGDQICIDALNQELLEAEGRLIEADARARGMRRASGVAVERNQDALAFEQGIALELEQIAANGLAMNAELDRLARDARASVTAAYDLCLQIESHFGIVIPECHPIVTAMAPVGVSDVAAAPSAFAGIRAHAFLLFSYRLPLPGDYAAYTYVVFPAWAAEETAATAFGRYEKLLEAIVRHTQGAAFATQPRKQLNLFAIPSTITCDEPNDPESCLAERSNSDFAAEAGHYDFNLGLALGSILNSGDLLKPEIQDEIAGEKGPFLVTTQKPIHLMPAGAAGGGDEADAAEGGYLPLMLVDLSEYDPGSFVRIVAAYKEALIDAPPTTQTIWTPPSKEWIYANVVKVGALSESLISAVSARIEELKAL